MRVRKLDANGDMVFGHGSTDFYIDTPQCVAQCVKTRLLLLTGEWFLDLTQGTAWNLILGVFGTVNDDIIKSTILGTDGVVALGDYVSTLDDNTRVLTITDDALVTAYGTASLAMAIPVGGFGRGPFGQGGFGN